MYKIIFILGLAITCSAVPLEVSSESNRISNGNLAANLQFPYAWGWVSIQLAAGNQAVVTRGHRCGGALITFQHVLTAAYCMFEWNPDGTSQTIAHANYRVFAGAHLLTNDTSSNVRTIANYTIHPNYLGIPSHVNDIAIVTLTTPFPNGTVVPISLPSASYNPADLTACTVAGWGAPTYAATVAASTELRYASKYIYNQNLCAHVYSLQQVQPNILPSMVCAASENIISTGCVGDEGNALVCDNTLTGILVWHTNCAPTSYPEIYTRVSNYTTWIRSVTGSANTVTPAASAFIFLTLMQMVYVSLLR